MTVSEVFEIFKNSKSIEDVSTTYRFGVRCFYGHIVGSEFRLRLSLIDFRNKSYLNIFKEVPGIYGDTYWLGPINPMDVIDDIADKQGQKVAEEIAELLIIDLGFFPEHLLSLEKDVLFETIENDLLEWNSKRSNLP